MRIFIARIMEYKYKCTQQQSGFIPDIINCKVLGKYEPRKYIEGFITKSTSPTKHLWKNIVNRQTNLMERTKLREILNQNKYFDAYKLIHPKISSHPAWLISLKHPHIREAAQCIVSLAACIKPTIDAELLCEKCGCLYDKPPEHVILHRIETTRVRDEMGLYKSTLTL